MGKQCQTIFLGFKITAGGDCSHEIKRRSSITVEKSEILLIPDPFLLYGSFEALLFVCSVLKVYSNTVSVSPFQSGNLHSSFVPTLTSSPLKIFLNHFIGHFLFHFLCFPFVKALLFGFELPGLIL